MFRDKIIAGSVIATTLFLVGMNVASYFHPVVKDIEPSDATTGEGILGPYGLAYEQATKVIALSVNVLPNGVLHMMGRHEQIAVQMVGGFDAECSDDVGFCFALQDLPKTDTPFPCGNPEHWLVRYEGN